VPRYASPMPGVQVDPRNVHEFEDEQAFEAWLRKNWNKEQEVWIKIHKVRSGLRSITPDQAIDVCLCWGWIDGLRKGHDETSFLQRYTPRTKKSIWSQINVAKIERLSQQRRMQPPGVAQVDAAKADGRWAAAYRMSNSEPPPDLLAAIRADREAAATYETLSAQNRFSLTFRTQAVKSAEARQRRIAAFVEMLKQGRTIHPNGKAATAKRPPSPRRETAPTREGVAPPGANKQRRRAGR
jgi:uncharacterized protein YdeI (YjbR/CyaY-like superfamily)